MCKQFSYTLNKYDRDILIEVVSDHTTYCLLTIYVTFFDKTKKVAIQKTYCIEVNIFVI